LFFNGVGEVRNYMVYNPLVSLFSKDGFPVEIQKEFPWQDYGVTHKYIIFFTGRTGSTLLTKLILSTGLCGNPEEYFSEQFIPHKKKVLGEISFFDYLAHLAKTTSSNGYFGVEIDSLRFQWLQKLIDFDAKVFEAESTRFLWLTRQDLVSQGYSYAAAKTSGLWHVFTGDNSATQAPFKEQKEITDHQIWDNILHILQYEQKMEQFFDRKMIEPLRLNYEQLVTDKTLVLGRILNFLGLNLDDYIKKIMFEQEPTEKMKYDKKTETLLRFYDKYEQLIQAIEKNRKTIPIASIRCDLPWGTKVD
jgi:LPS sulfotransferase NodH